MGAELAVRWFTIYMRRGASPGAAYRAERMESETDVRHVLSAIHVPTLILHRAEDEPEANRYMAEHIRGRGIRRAARQGARSVSRRPGKRP